jgi:hypothetical protein
MIDIQGIAIPCVQCAFMQNTDATTQRGDKSRLINPMANPVVPEAETSLTKTRQVFGICGSHMQANIQGSGVSTALLEI